jgi:NTP pyrophosphatase (non-canonical NTP hydrolase)
MSENDALVPDEAAGLVNMLVGLCHGDSMKAGWWKDTDPDNPYVVPTKLMLTVSELGEGMEGHRKQLMDDKLPNRPMLEVELADAMIRICDLAGWLNYDLGGALAEKLAYNRVRADHKPEARAAAGGKTY